MSEKTVTKKQYWCMFCNYRAWLDVRGEEFKSCPRCGNGMFVWEGSVMFDDLDLIADVLPDYALGRRRGLTDEETERRARAALTWAINRILEQGEK